MNAIRVHQTGGPEVLRLEEVPDPVPNEQEVVVRVRAAGVNPVDTYIRSGAYARTPALPYTPGSDGAGIVEATGGSVQGLKRGDRVYMIGTAPGRSSGAYAEQAVCESWQVFRLPDAVSFSQGAAIGVPYGTAYRALFQRAHAMPGDIVLVHGGSGGVGIAAIQLAKSHGIRVIATAGTADGLALIRAEGADHAVNHHAADAAEQIMTATAGRGADVILEMLANVNLDHDLGMIAMRGRVVVIGSRGRIEIDPRQIMRHEAAVFGMLLFNAEPADFMRIHAAIGAGLANGTLRPVVGREFPLAEAPRAHEAVMRPGAHGKIVLVP